MRDSTLSQIPSHFEERLEEMIEQAKRVSEKAYAPYSRFYVGAALLSSSGEIYVGCNIENRSYGATVCAERNAMAHAVVAGDTSIIACVVFVDTEDAVTPCGMCRQVLAEFNPTMDVVWAGRQGAIGYANMSSLAPGLMSMDTLTGVQEQRDALLAAKGTKDEGLPE